MSRIEWDAIGSRFYESGVDRGVLYVNGQAGVPWNGLTAVSETSSGGEAKSYYIDGVKFANIASPEEYQATLSAFAFPKEFSLCDGTAQPRSGLYLTRQRRRSFGFTYRTRIGNEQTPDLGYKIHIIYNALASPSERSNTTVGDSPDTTDFSWNITTRPPAMSGYRRTSHVLIDSRDTDPIVLALVEDILYGNDVDMPRLPDLSELIAAFDTISTLVVVDNGDGTWTATAPYDVIRMLDETTFEITAPTAIFIDEDSYTLSSE